MMRELDLATVAFREVLLAAVVYVACPFFALGMLAHSHSPTHLGVWLGSGLSVSALAGAVLVYSVSASCWFVRHVVVWSLMS